MGIEKRVKPEKGVSWSDFLQNKSLPQTNKVPPHKIQYKSTYNPCKETLRKT